MLVLSRREHEKLSIGDDITITIVRIGSGAVKVGIDAPKGVNIVRAELKGQPDERDEDEAAG